MVLLVGWNDSLYVGLKKVRSDMQTQCGWVFSLLVSLFNMLYITHLVALLESSVSSVFLSLFILCLHEWLFHLLHGCHSLLNFFLKIYVLVCVESVPLISVFLSLWLSHSWITGINGWMFLICWSLAWRSVFWPISCFKTVYLSVILCGNHIFNLFNGLGSL